VGWAKIPAEAPGKGVNGQDFVSMSGGSGEIINPQGRDKSFQEFSQDKLGIMIGERLPVALGHQPQVGIDPMKDRDSAVGWAKIPAEAPGKGVNGQDFVSMSGGSGEIINP
ncbi:hypothetical protein CTI14_56310, partial [Methylobacterium radiotolerans]